jgi:hypothetical protein
MREASDATRLCLSAIAILTRSPEMIAINGLWLLCPGRIKEELPPFLKKPSN